MATEPHRFGRPTIARHSVVASRPSRTRSGPSPAPGPHRAARLPAAARRRPRLCLDPPPPRRDRGTRHRTGRRTGRRLTVHDQEFTMITASPPPGDSANAPTLPANWNQGLHTTGYLESHWLAATLGVLFVAVVAATVWLWVRRRRAGLLDPAPGAAARRHRRPAGRAVPALRRGHRQRVRRLRADDRLRLRRRRPGHCRRLRIDQLSIGAPSLDVPRATRTSTCRRATTPPSTPPPLPGDLSPARLPGRVGSYWVRAGDMQPILDKLIQDRLIQPMIASLRTRTRLGARLRDGEPGPRPAAGDLPDQDGAGHHRREVPDDREPVRPGDRRHFQRRLRRAEPGAAQPGTFSCRSR